MVSRVGVAGGKAGQNAAASSHGLDSSTGEVVPLHNFHSQKKTSTHKIYSQPKNDNKKRRAHNSNICSSNKLHSIAQSAQDLGEAFGPSPASPSASCPSVENNRSRN